MLNNRIKVDSFKGKDYGYLNNTEFLVQVAKNNSHSTYKTTFKCWGDLVKAGKFYDNMQPIPNYKKRIVMVGNLGETIIDKEIFK